MQKIELTREIFHGAVDLEFRSDGTVQPWRINLADRDLFFASEMGSLPDVAALPSGVRVSIKSNTTRLRLTTFPISQTAYYDFDLVCDGKLLDSVRKDPIVLNPAATADAPALDFSDVEGFSRNLAEWQVWAAEHAEESPAGTEHIVEFDDIPEGVHLLELWLSNVGPQRLKKLEIDQGSTWKIAVDSRPRWITHGSSITHCMGIDAMQFPGLPFGTGSAWSPARTWPATAARLADLNLTSLGYGGQCCLDQPVARMIRELPADVISLKLGINVHNHGAMGLRSFGQAALGFIQTIREGRHAETPLLIISPIWGGFREDLSHSALVFAPDREETDPRFPNLKQMRQELKRVVGLLRTRGDENLIYLDGSELFSGADYLKNPVLMPDELHPNGDGYELMGERFASLAFGPGGCLLPGRAK